MDGLDGLRGIAAVAVVGFHIVMASGAIFDRWWSPVVDRLNVTVPIFFALSGYVMYRPFVRARVAGRPRPSISAYAGRRALRIIPAYWMALALLAIYPGLLVEASWTTYALFGQVYSRDTIFTGIPPVWSLAVEVTFYALLPLHVIAMDALAARNGHARAVQRELLALGTFVLAGLATRIASHVASPEFPLTSYTLAGTVGWFAVGMSLAVAEASNRLPDAKPAVAMAAAALAWIPGIVLLPGSGVPAEYGLAQWSFEYLSYTLVAALLVISCLGRRAGKPRAVPLFGRPTAIWLGTISYGIFLWHFPIVQAVTEWNPLLGAPGMALIGITAIAMALTLSAAAVSWYVLERPLLRRFAYRRASRTGDSPTWRPPPISTPS